MEAEFYREKLANGVTLLFEKRSLPIFASATAVRFGSAYETADVKGIAHFIEHMVFKGSEEKNAEQISREIEKRGGVMNGFTDEEITAYWNKLPAKHFHVGLEINHELVARPAFKPEEFEKEKKVILEEIKMYHDNPVVHSIDKIKFLLYEKPFGVSTAGTLESVSAMTREMLVDFYSKAYGTNNMILVAVGKADFKELKDFVLARYKKNLCDVRKGAIVKRYARETETRKGLEQTHFVLGFHTSTLAQRERYAWELAMAHLAGGMSSRLFQEIREKRGLAYAVKGSLDMGSNYGYGYVYVGTMKEKLKEVEKLVLGEIKKLAELSQKELEEAKEQLIGIRQLESESSEMVMQELLREEIAGNAARYYEYEKQILDISLDEIHRLSKLDGYSVFTLLPS